MIVKTARFACQDFHPSAALASRRLRESSPWTRLNCCSKAPAQVRVFWKPAASDARPPGVRRKRQHTAAAVRTAIEAPDMAS